MSVPVHARNASRRPVRLGVVCIVFGVCAVLSLALVQPKRTAVLFICPHGAAKSVVASAYFQRIARERGLNVRVEAAGVEPRDTVSSVVAEHLRRNEYTVPVTKPRAVTRADLDEADVVISMGCDVTRLPPAPRTLQQWDDVPGPSEDFSSHTCSGFFDSAGEARSAMGTLIEADLNRRCRLV